MKSQHIINRFLAVCLFLTSQSIAAYNIDTTKNNQPLPLEVGREVFGIREALHSFTPSVLHSFNPSVIYTLANF